ncbi:MAG: class I SAM-dependent methyltransferase [Candidatus Krumholzibacteria bacterium]|jgi:SAM-dependent methyltransferase|nr:class I SAM-dependent methyltransferase [Candidatus Krumholzibacteria bacterium]
MKRMQAEETKSFESILAGLPGEYAMAEKRLRQLDRIVHLPPNAAILDVGAAQGEFLAACHRLGYRASGVEPWKEARETAARLAAHLSIPLDIREGRAESLPFGDGVFDVVHAVSVLEHVTDLEASVSEAFRVLKPGGVFWFNTASSLCPATSEIAGFPLFGWYPNGLKLRIMEWAKHNRPELIGYTEHPAIHWFTPRKARRLLKRHGFTRIYDRWDIGRANAKGGLRGLVLRTIALGWPTKFAADVLRRGCNYAAVK